MSEPPDHVLARAYYDFEPERPYRPPWQRPRAVLAEHAYTGTLCVVALRIADRVRLRGLDRPSFEQDEPYEDWTRASWGVSGA